MRCIRNWDDDRATRLLRNCRRAIRSDGKLLVIEPVVTPNWAPPLHLLSQRLITPAHDRIESEHRVLLRAADFDLTRMIPLDDMSILEATPV
jgi:hypothetical protein